MVWRHVFWSFAALSAGCWSSTPRDAGPDAAAVNEDVLTVLLALDAASCERMLRDCFGSCAEGLDCLGGDVRTCAAACPD